MARITGSRARVRSMERMIVAKVHPGTMVFAIATASEKARFHTMRRLPE